MVCLDAVCCCGRRQPLRRMVVRTSHPPRLERKLGPEECHPWRNGVDVLWYSGCSNAQRDVSPGLHRRCIVWIPELDQQRANVAERLFSRDGRGVRDGDGRRGSWSRRYVINAGDWIDSRSLLLHSDLDYGRPAADRGNDCFVRSWGIDPPGVIVMLDESKMNLEAAFLLGDSQEVKYVLQHH